MERTSDIGVFDVTEPTDPKPAGPPSEYILYNDEDISPEGMDFISASDSPTGKPLLAVAYEYSGTVAVYEAQATCEPPPCPSWCSEWTITDSACAYCPLANEPTCAAYCNAHTCGNDHCKDCDVCHAIETGMHCLPWCTEWIQPYMPVAMCGGCVF